MLNPPDSFPGSSSSDDLLKRITQRVQQNKVDQKILEILQQAFSHEFDKTNIVLSRPERILLFQQVSKTILTNVLGKLIDTK